MKMIDGTKIMDEMDTATRKMENERGVSMGGGEMGVEWIR
jgi:hypothetical protein